MPNNPRFPPRPFRVEILAFPGVQLLDVAGPLQVFASANDLSPPGVAKPYDATVVASGPLPVPSSAGLALQAARLPDAATPLDTLVVAGGSGVYPAMQAAALLEWVRERAAVARRRTSVCSGAFLLAAAGLLDDRRVATHWSRCEQLARQFPRLRVESDPIFIQDGPVWTSAGITAGIDLALALVEADCGRALALAVARQLVVFLKRPGGQAQYSATLALQSADAAFDALHSWMTDNVCADLSVPRLAARAGMSERSFVRHYRRTTGQTPARAVERYRVEAARRLLEQESSPLKRVAHRCGFGSEETMRRSFLRLLGTSPGDYRARFSTPGPYT